MGRPSDRVDSDRCESKVTSLLPKQLLRAVRPVVLHQPVAFTGESIGQQQIDSALGSVPVDYAKLLVRNGYAGSNELTARKGLRRRLRQGARLVGCEAQPSHTVPTSRRLHIGGQFSASDVHSGLQLNNPVYDEIGARCNLDHPLTHYVVDCHEPV